MNSCQGSKKNATKNIGLCILTFLASITTKKKKKPGVIQSVVKKADTVRVAVSAQYFQMKLLYCIENL